MPELAEVEYYRQQWDPGLGGRIEAVRLHRDKRIFRGTQPEFLSKALSGTFLRRSEAHGKQMLFHFSGGHWLGLHLGMTGQLRVEKPGFEPGKHDHLVLFQELRVLVFSDPRQFGRVRFHVGSQPPLWWVNLPAVVTSEEFTPKLLAAFLQRRAKLPIKAALLLQSRFPGIGNWMADEILWRAGLDPRTSVGQLTKKQVRKLWRTLRFVCRHALGSIRRGYSAFPPDWLFHQRWDSQGHCPRHRLPLLRETIGGRTTVWCSRCQPTVLIT